LEQTLADAVASQLACAGGEPDKVA
jgi:hypothetical protein